LADAALDERITALFEANYRVYGVRKMWKALNRQERLDEHGTATGQRYEPVARCTVARRMKALASRAPWLGTTRRSAPRSPVGTGGPRTS
jgi:putative transposase